MTGKESVFSCINHKDIHAEAARHIPPLSPTPVSSSSSPMNQQEDLGGQVATLEAKIIRLEERDCAAALAVEVFKAEAQIAQRRASELEREAEGLKKRDETFSLLMGQLREELAALRTRVGSVEKIICRLDPSNLNSVALSVGLLEGRLKNLEADLANEFKERFSALDAAFGEASLKAGLARETAYGSARCVEKMEERIARLPYLENRLNASEVKLERIYDLEVLSESLKVSVDGMVNKFSAAMRESAVMSVEHEKNCSDFESLSHQVKQLTALFNHFRSELSFLMPKKQGSIGS